MPICYMAPSILSADFARLADEANNMTTAGAEWLHVDVMDGHFVPNLTIGAPVVESLRKHTKAFLDCHLMVSNPEQWVDDFKHAGADRYTFHIEATNNPVALIEKIKAAGMKVGIALRPKTSYEAVLPFGHLVDLLLVMTVEPGFGGQSFMPDMADKVRALRKAFPNTNIEVDGGITVATIQVVAEAGANCIVSGSGIFKHPSPKDAIAAMRDVVNKYATAQATTESSSSAAS